jgi:hypothetical protein
MQKMRIYDEHKEGSADSCCAFQDFVGFCGHGDNLVLCADAGICGGVNYFDEAEW